jgi:hypothetical protein
VIPRDYSQGVFVSVIYITEAQNHFYANGKSARLRWRAMLLGGNPYRAKAGAQAMFTALNMAP